MRISEPGARWSELCAIARRCKRCGGILLSEEAQRDGMGHHCKEKYALEHPEIDPNQITFEDDECGEIRQKGN